MAEGWRIFRLDDLLFQLENERGRSGGSSSSSSEDEDSTAAPEVTSPTADNQGVDSSQVKILLESVKNADLKILRKTAEAVKEFLLPADKKPRVKKLMESKDLLPFLVKCLKATSDCAFFQQTAAWTLEVILETSKDLHISKIGGSEIGSLLVNALASSDLDVLNSVTSTLSLLTFFGGPGLRSKLVSWNILSALANLLKNNQNLTEDILITINRVVSNLTSPNMRDLISRHGVTDAMDLMPPTSVIMKAMPIISLLLDTNNDTIRRKMLCSICALVVALDEIGPFVEHGFCPKLASYTSYSEENVLVGLVTAIGSIAAMGVDALLDFLKAVESKDGLKDIWKCFGLEATTHNLENDGALVEFLETLDVLVYKDGPENAVTNTVIQSGLADGLALTLKKNSCHRKFKCFAMSILGGLCFYNKEVPKARQQVIANMGILRNAIRFLESENPAAVDGAATVIAMLLDSSPERREEALNLGLLSSLAKVVQRKVTKWVFSYSRGGKDVVLTVNNQIAIRSAIKALKNIVKAEPRPAIPTLQRILKTLVKFLSSNVENTEDNYEIKAKAILCIAEFVECADGRKILFEKPNIVKKQLDFLDVGDEPDLQFAALELIRKVFLRGDPQNRKSVWEMGVLQRFDKLLKSEYEIIQVKTLACLMLFLNQEQLTAAQRAAIVKLKPNVSKIIKKKNSITRELARSVYHKMTVN